MTQLVQVQGTCAVMGDIPELARAIPTPKAKGSKGNRAGNNCPAMTSGRLMRGPSGYVRLIEMPPPS